MFLRAYAPAATAGPNLISGTTVAASDFDPKLVPQGCKTYLPYSIICYVIHYTKFLALHEKED